MISAAQQKRSRAALLLALLFGVIAGCGANRGDSDFGQAPTESLDTLRATALELIGEPVCENVSQCRSIAFGSKPCGGPWSYVAYSTQATDSAKLAAAVAEYNGREAQLNRELGRASDCRFVGPPKLACVASRCSAEK